MFFLQHRNKPDNFLPSTIARYYQTNYKIIIFPSVVNVECYTSFSHSGLFTKVVEIGNNGNIDIRGFTPQMGKLPHRRNVIFGIII